MIYIILLIIAVGIYEITKMSKDKLKREIVVWIVMAVMTIAFTIYVYSDANTMSLSAMIMKFLNIDY